MEKKKNYKKHYYLTLIISTLLLAILIFCYTTGRIISGDNYKRYNDFKNEYSKYFQIQEILREEALGYCESSDGMPSGSGEEIYKNLMKSLDDPYADYFTAKEYGSFERKFAESYDGVGISLGDVKIKGEKGIRIMVYSTFADSPAEKAGIKPGDFIVRVDGVKIKNSEHACDHMLGKPGTKVKVTIERKGVEKSFTMERATIEEKAVVYKKLDKKNKIGYIYVSTFKEGTCEEFKLAVKDLKNAGYEKFIIDFRNNGGGMTDQAYDLADYILPEGVIVTEKDKAGNENSHTSDASSAGLDFVLLVNKQTASASEIVACALQDNKACKIIGETTYGKGVTQAARQLSDGSAIKYTVQEYFRPSGKTVNKVGVVPDIKVKKPDNNAKIFKVAKQALLKGAN